MSTPTIRSATAWSSSSPLDDPRRDGHIARVRRRVGTDHLLVPGVTICLFRDESLLLARHAAAEGRWITPGGAVEPDESVADAAVREAAEELGVQARPTGVVGVFGPHRVTYPNGDVTSYSATMFAMEVVAGTPEADQEELLELGWFREDEVDAIEVADWLRPLLPAIFGWRRDGRTRFPGDAT